MLLSIQTPQRREKRPHHGVFRTITRQGWVSSAERIDESVFSLTKVLLYKLNKID